MNDKANPFPRVNTPLFFPEDPEFGFSSGTSGPSRRKFLKRTGGATLATAMSWVVTNQRAGGEVILSYIGSGAGAWGIKPIEPKGTKGKIEENGDETDIEKVAESINTTENQDGNFAYRSRWLLYVIWNRPATDNELAYAGSATNAVTIIWEETLQRRTISPVGDWGDTPAGDEYLGTRTLHKLEEVMSITKTIHPSTGIVQNTPAPTDYAPQGAQRMTATWDLDDSSLTLDEEGELVADSGKDSLVITGNGGDAPVHWEVELRFHRRFGTGNG